MNTTAVTIISSLASGILATIITLVVTNILQKRKECYNYKMKIFQDAIAYRTDIANGSVSTGNFQKTMNQVFIAYNDCPEVLVDFENFRKLVIYKDNTKLDNDKIIEALLLLLKAMAKEVKINYDFSNDDLFTKPLIMGH